MLQTAILDQRVKKEWKQDYTHVDHSQLDIPYHLESCTPYCGFWFAQALCDFETSTYCVCGFNLYRGSNRLWSTWYSLVFFFFFFKGQYSCYFLNKIFFTLVSSLFCFVVVSLLLSSRGELWRSTSSVS